jgi:hypothetical protein
MQIVKANPLIVILVWLTMVWTGLAATNYYVATNGPGSAFTNWTTAASSIQDAIDKTINGDTVWVSNGTYYLTNQISITKVITVQGWTNNGIVTVDGQSNCRCFYVNAYNATGTVDGFNVINGVTNGANGGGFYLKYGGIVQNCTISNCTANNGGGIGTYLFASNMLISISNCTIANNTATNASGNTGGGGIFIDYDRYDITIVGCIVQNNFAGRHGGGIFIYSSAGIISNCAVIGNTTGDGYGGGIRFQHSAFGDRPAIIDNCVIVSNRALGVNYGGGICHPPSTYGLIITNCRVSGNSCAGYFGAGVYLGAGGQLVNSYICNNNNTSISSGAAGGGIYNSGGLVKNCVITNNTTLTNTFSSVKFGGGIYNSGAATNINCLIAYNISGYGGGICDGNGSLNINCTIASNYANGAGGGYYASAITNQVVENCIIYHNTSPAGSNCYITNSAIYFTNCCAAPLTGLSGSGNTSNNPAFVSKDAGDWHLAANSPCINAGLNEAWMNSATDLDGRHRLDVFSRLVDMGCYEYLPAGSMYQFGF